MNYTKEDFVDTAKEEALNCIANARRLTRMYASADYMDTEKNIRFFPSCLAA